VFTLRIIDCAALVRNTAITLIIIIIITCEIILPEKVTVAMHCNLRPPVVKLRRHACSTLASLPVVYYMLWHVSNSSFIKLVHLQMCRMLLTVFLLCAGMRVCTVCVLTASAFIRVWRLLDTGRCFTRDQAFISNLYSPNITQLKWKHSGRICTHDWKYINKEKPTSQPGMAML